MLSQERKAAKHLWVHRTAPAADRGPTDKQLVEGLVEGPWEEAGMMPKWSCCPHPRGFGVQTQEFGLWEDTVQSQFQPFIGKPRLKGMVQNWVEAGLGPVTRYPGDWPHLNRLLIFGASDPLTRVVLNGIRSCQPMLSFLASSKELLLRTRHHLPSLLGCCPRSASATAKVTAPAPQLLSSSRHCPRQSCAAWAAGVCLYIFVCQRPALGPSGPPPKLRL